MSATNCPETPRQKMIGMMYLFYTALLALNVSNEVIEAFIYVNESLQTTAINYREKSVQVYQDIGNMYETQPDKFENQWKTAQKVHHASDSLFDFIEDIKMQVIRHSQGDDTTSSIKYVKKQDDTNAANEIMTAELGPRLGWKLEEEVIKYRELLLSVVGDTSDSGKFLKRNITSSLATEARKGKHDDSPKPWPESLTKGMPLVATYALLTKLQSDLRNVETDIYSYLIGDAEKLDIKISELEALVAAPGGVMPGSRFFGRVFIGAKDTTMEPKIWVTHSEPFYDSVQINGKWEYKRVEGKKYDLLKLDDTGAGVIDTLFNASGSFGGVAVYESNLGAIIRPFKHIYTVGSRSGAITPTKMMVLYAGIDNPLEYSASGGADSKPYLNVSHGIAARPTGANSVVINPPASLVGQSVTLSVGARNADGTTTPGTTQQFEIWRVPQPVIYLSFGNASVKEGNVSVNNLLDGKLVALKPSTFPFSGITYSVKSFEVNVKGQLNAIAIQGDKISNNQTVVNLLQRYQNGDVIAISSVTVITPSGQERIGGPSFIVIR
jgi:gliding motility-associated protein GldM